MSHGHAEVEMCHVAELSWSVQHRVQATWCWHTEPSSVMHSQNPAFLWNLYLYLYCIKDVEVTWDCACLCLKLLLLEKAVFPSWQIEPFTYQEAYPWAAPQHPPTHLALIASNFASSLTIIGFVNIMPGPGSWWQGNISLKIGTINGQISHFLLISGRFQG